jgi:hypothetical protein
MENDIFTTPPQQLHNTSSHGGGAQCVGLTPMSRGVVQLLWWRCVRIKSQNELYLKVAIYHISFAKD